MKKTIFIFGVVLLTSLLMLAAADEKTEIAEGKKEWIPLIRNFYKPFHKNLELKNKELDKKDSINVGIIFRLGQTEETYHKLIKEIDESTTEEELNSVDVIGMGRSFRAVINKDGLNKLKDNTNILEIGLIRQ